MKLLTFARLLSKKLFSKREADYAGFVLAQRFASYCSSKAILGEYGKLWVEDGVFFDSYRKFEPSNPASAERKFFLRSLLSLVENLPGDTAECGVYKGAASWFICDKFRATDKTHFVFDSFEGLSAPSTVDGEYWSEGDLRSDEDVLKENLSAFPQVRVCKGWIPDSFHHARERSFCFVHIDVDLYQPTLASIEFFYPRLVEGGIILCDDYGFITCPGSRKALDEYMKDKPEKIVHVPTGQAFIIKGAG
ncbi:MAG: class I SAM-dependent methyltransferase [Pyrinomonadaceae bacterium]|nr:class I SAM-dependent methyltransferase [Pyrinomonadaceae bacterium]